MKSIVTLFFLIISFLSYAQTNLLDPSTWTLGNGSVAGFSRNGTDAENIRELGTNPHGDNVVLWKAVPDATSNADGGWNSDYHNIDPAKTYRFTVWIKKTNSTGGYTYFGLYSLNASGSHTTLMLDDTERPNAYFWNGDLPELDKWYLLVGFMHGSSYAGSGVTGGIYDGTTGVKVLNAHHDFKFRSDATRIRHRSYLYYDTNTADRQFFWEPAVYEVNGQEPTITDLISPGNTGGGGTVWNTSGSDINYTGGKVGIGTSNPDYDLTVNGNIHAKEVKVDLSVPAPDYVFKENYNLKSLEEIREHINQYGHLPNIPSAKEMEENGVELGTMEMKLLEKVEELTLYILQQEQKLRQQENITHEVQMKNNDLEIRLSKLETLLNN